MADDFMSALRTMANNWVLKARDYARQSKEAGDNEAQASYNRGFAEGYYRAATELAALLKDAPAQKQPPKAPPAAPPTMGGQRRGASPMQAAPTQAAVPKVPAAPEGNAVKYALISVGEAISILVFAGCQPRDVTQNGDNSLRATFSSWGSMMIHEQISRVQNADPRIILLSNGKLESHDYYIDFAFKETDRS